MTQGEEGEQPRKEGEKPKQNFKFVKGQIYKLQKAGEVFGILNDASGVQSYKLPKGRLVTISESINPKSDDSLVKFSFTIEYEKGCRVGVAGTKHTVWCQGVPAKHLKRCKAARRRRLASNHVIHGLRRWARQH